MEPKAITGFSKLISEMAKLFFVVNYTSVQKARVFLLANALLKDVC
jgi:hypothetical protein